MKRSGIVVLGCAFLGGLLVWQQWRLAQLQTEWAAPRAAPSFTPKAAVSAKAVKGLIEGSYRDPLQGMADDLNYVRSLGPEEISAALAAMDKKPDGSARNLLKKMLLERWVEINPAAALAWMKENKGGRGGDYETLFQAWGAMDPEAALTALAQVSNADERAAAGRSMLQGIAATDPERALELFKQLPPGQQLQDTLTGIYGAWGSMDPKAARDAALAMPEGTTRSQALLAVTEAWSHQDPAAALTFAETLPAGEPRTTGITQAVAALADQDPTAAANYLDGGQKGLTHGMYDSLINAVAMKWADNDPAAALAWTGNVASGEMYDRVYANVVGEVAQSSPAQAATMLDGIKDTGQRMQAVSQVAGTWAETDLQGAIEWAQSLPMSDNDARSEALRDVMRNMDYMDPVSASAFVVQNFSDDPDFNVVAEQVAGHWSGMAADAPAALAWAETLPEGAARNESMATAVRYMALADPATAWSATGQISDAGARMNLMMMVVRSWGAVDPAAAAAAVQSSGLTEAQTAGLLKTVQAAGK